MKRSWWFRVLAVTVVGMHPAAAADAPASAGGPLAVEVADGLSLHDETRRKDLPYKVHFPADDGRYPLIVFSHGFGGSKDAFAIVGRHWASHGYVVIHPTHADGLERRNVEAAERRVGGGGLMERLNDPDRIADRVADIALVLDSRAEIEKATPTLAGRIDAGRIGVGGHSFGAYTTMLIGGVTVDLGGQQGRSFRDARVRCILPISPQGTGQQGLTDGSWAALTLPMMTITGTRDRGVGGQDVEWRKQPFAFSPPGDKFHVVIDGASHLSFGGGLGLRGSDITDVVMLASTRFWDAYLKGAEPARTYLESDRLIEDSGGRCTFERK